MEIEAVAFRNGAFKVKRTIAARINTRCELRIAEHQSGFVIPISFCPQS